MIFHFFPLSISEWIINAFSFFPAERGNYAENFQLFFPVYVRFFLICRSFLVWKMRKHKNQLILLQHLSECRFCCSYKRIILYFSFCSQWPWYCISFLCICKWMWSWILCIVPSADDAVVCISFKITVNFGVPVVSCIILTLLRLLFSLFRSKIS